MKKQFMALVLAITLVAGSSVTAFAGGGCCAGGYGKSVRGTSASGLKVPSGAAFYSCNVEDCNITRIHKHGSNWCYGHYEGDGHDHSNYRCFQ